MATDNRPPPVAAPATYDVARVVFLRFLGFVYLFALLAIHDQWVPLLGVDGLLPARAFLAGHRARLADASVLERMQSIPTLFWLTGDDGPDDDAALALIRVGIALSVVVLLDGGSGPVMLALWLVYTSVVNVGQTWYGFGWESQLLETGWLAAAAAPWTSLGTRSPRWSTPHAYMALFLVLEAKIMLGAGLIKVRAGDDCWWPRLNCLRFFFETQPQPNPVSFYMHHMPNLVLDLGVVVNHVVELVVPWFLVVPGLPRVRQAAAALSMGFMATLIVSGNFSVLNWLTLIPCIWAFPDSAWPRSMRAKIRARGAAGWPALVPSVLVAGAVALLSIPVVVNLFGGGPQAMNRSFEPLRLVNTYGAFGTVTRVREELVWEGTNDARGAHAPEEAWKEYEFYCKPGRVDRAPCVAAPYHHRLSWLLWFAAMQRVPERHPWTVHLSAKLLAGDAAALTLVEENPFADAPPAWLRVRQYRYEFAPLQQPGTGGAWWTREFRRVWLKPMSLKDAAFRRFLVDRGWGGAVGDVGAGS